MGGGDGVTAVKRLCRLILLRLRCLRARLTSRQEDYYGDYTVDYYTDGRPPEYHWRKV